MNTFKKGDVVELADRNNMRVTVNYTNGPYVYYADERYPGANAHYSTCKLVPQPKFGPGDVVHNGSSTHTIKCVKTCYETDGAPYTGLAAYDYTDGGWDREHSLALVRRANPAPTAGYAAASPKPMLADVFEYINAGRVIEAIRQYRTIYGVGLKEAKDTVEAIRAAMKLAAPDKFKVGDSVVTSAVNDAGVGTITRKNADGTYGVQFGGRYGHCHEEECCLSLTAPVTARDSIVVRFENGKYQPNSPPKVHPTLAEATAEAERLAKKEPGIAFAAFSLATTSTATRPAVTTVKA